LGGELCRAMGLRGCCALTYCDPRGTQHVVHYASSQQAPVCPTPAPHTVVRGEPHSDTPSIAAKQLHRPTSDGLCLFRCSLTGWGMGSSLGCFSARHAAAAAVETGRGAGSGRRLMFYHRRVAPTTGARLPPGRARATGLRLCRGTGCHVVGGGGGGARMDKRVCEAYGGHAGAQRHLHRRRRALHLGGLLRSRYD
jgi:hypothetical protein